MIGTHEVLATIKGAVELLKFDELIISMPPEGTSQRLPLDLPAKVRELGVLVTG